MLLFNLALMVKWISRWSSEPLFQVRILVSAQSMGYFVQVGGAKVPKRGRAKIQQNFMCDHKKQCLI